jgi:hypothetical protein
VIHQRAPNAKDFTNRRYRHHGLAKNLNRLEVTAALAKLCVVRRRIAESPGKVSVEVGKRVNLCRNTPQPASKLSPSARSARNPWRGLLS